MGEVWQERESVGVSQKTPGGARTQRWLQRENGKASTSCAETDVTVRFRTVEMSE